MNAQGKNLSWLFEEPEDDDLSSHAHRQLIGCVGLVLPLLLWLVAGLRPTAVNVNSWELLRSISAYYYSPAVSAFSGSLVAMALFFFAYRGYDNEYGLRDRVAAIIAGIAALLVAFFPAGAPKAAQKPFWWTNPIGTIHYAAAVVLFCSFVFFCLWQFRRSNKNSEKWDWGKRTRNWIYILCGVAIVLSLVWAAVASIAEKPIFWPETLALEFFAISWLVKGRADKTVGNALSAVRGKRGKPVASP